MGRSRPRKTWDKVVQGYHIVLNIQCDLPDSGQSEVEVFYQGNPSKPMLALKREMRIAEDVLCILFIHFVLFFHSNFFHIQFRDSIGELFFGLIDIVINLNIHFT